ncbi:Hypothetical predicted protein, partial [Podarcis lilfordi]
YDECSRLLDRSPINMFHDGYQDYTSMQASRKETKAQNEHLQDPIKRNCFQTTLKDQLLLEFPDDIEEH